MQQAHNVIGQVRTKADVCYNSYPANTTACRTTPLQPPSSSMKLGNLNAAATNRDEPFNKQSQQEEEQQLQLDTTMAAARTAVNQMILPVVLLVTICNYVCRTNLEYGEALWRCAVTVIAQYRTA